MARKASVSSYVVVTPLKHNKVRYERGARFPADAATPEQIEALLGDGVPKDPTAKEEPEAASGGPPASSG